MCQTGIVYARTVDTETLTFGVDGSLIYNSLVMYDRETNSRWSQFLGRAVDGPKQDAELSFVPSVIVFWGAWKAEHPDTLFLDTGSSRRPQDTYEEYYLDPDMVGVYGESNPDRRFDRKDIVLGVSLGDHARAYALGDLFRKKVINDSLGDTNVVAVFDERSGLAAIFERAIAERSLTLRQGDEPLQMIDEETNSVWNKLDGKATAGPLQGERLTMIPSFQLFWFAWSDFYPDTTVYRAPQSP